MSNADASAEPVSIEVITADGTTIVKLAGELDMSSSSALFDAVTVMRPLTTELVVDLSAVGFIDSSGLRALLAGRQAIAEDRGGRLRLTGCTSSVVRLLELSGTKSLFDIDS